MEPMSCDDLVFITCSLYPELDLEMVKKMVDFNSKVNLHALSLHNLYLFSVLMVVSRVLYSI